MKESNIKVGRPWKTVAKFATYNEADQKRSTFVGENEKLDFYELAVELECLPH